MITLDVSAAKHVAYSALCLSLVLLPPFFFLSFLVSTLEAAVASFGASHQELSDNFDRTQGAISRAVASFTQTQDQYVPDQQLATCDGGICQPSVEAEGNTIKINAPYGRVRVIQCALIVTKREDGGRGTT